MAYLVGILIGLAIGWLLPWQRLPALRDWNVEGARNRLRALVADARRAWQAPAGAALPQQSTTAPTLSAQLHGLDAAIQAFSHSLSHPAEFREHAEFKQAVQLLRNPDVPLQTVMQYAVGVNWALNSVALAALEERADRGQAAPDVVAHFDKLAPFAMYFALHLLLVAEPRPPAGAPATGAREWWTENPVIPVIFREYFLERERLGDAPEFGPAIANVPDATLPEVRSFLSRLNLPFAERLLEALQGRQQRASIDRVFLTSFGRFWDVKSGSDILIEAEAWRDGLVEAREPSVRSLLMSGDSGVGKTSFLRLLARHLANDGWEVFEAGNADLMAGQQWFGQLEGRIQRSIDELAAAKKLIWYIPDLLQIALSGTHQGQAASILDQILPAVASGRLIVWTEASATGTARLLRQRPALKSALEAVRLEAQSLDETRILAEALVERLASQYEVPIQPGCVEGAVGAARQYLSTSSFPGAVLDLIKLAVTRGAKAGERIDAQQVIATLAQLTGLPVSILDHQERVNLTALREHFSARVIGQNEAVTAVVERIAMLKAGLNDPGKPIGVFLFAGPTGTGKTELAKVLCEFLFGSVERLIRLDMSEFQTPESTTKILGSPEAPVATDSLINRVRKQPFSVILLDEFEKAHANVWDLFLQVFDDGRLTDSLGYVADFRHTIIILTTNLGATAHRTSGLGFGTAAADTFSSEQILRAVSQTFRPEFQNRLDKVIVFHPLTRDLMRGILKKELDLVLQRRGLKDRVWAVEWEASAQDFLLEKGFSPEMGARPLKRAIDQYVIAPLAATIVEKRFPEGDQFVFVRSDGRAIQAEFVDPDTDAPSLGSAAGTQSGEPPTLSAMMLAPGGTTIEARALDGEYAILAEMLAAPEWEDLKIAIAEPMRSADFWSRPDRHRTLARLALMDRVKAATSTAGSLRERLATSSRHTGKSSRELVSRLAQQLYLIKEGMRDVREDAPIEVALCVEPAFDKPGDNRLTRDWCSQLQDMYRGWAGKRNMQLAEVAGERPGDPPLLLISGFGAHRCLAQEIGLHVLDLGDDDKRGARATARVVLTVAPLGDVPEAKLRGLLLQALQRQARPQAIVRRYRGDPSPLVRNMNGNGRTGRLDAVLQGDFDLIASA